MGKNKLARWTELESFNNVIQPPIEEVVSPGDKSSADKLTPETARDHPVKGRWNEMIFRNQNPVVLELGCGRGEYTIGLASKYPGRNYVGIDIKGARLWRGAKTSNEKKMENAAFLRTRIEFIGSFFAENEVDEIWITFPDPHPGTRNSNKRLTSPWYLNAYRKIMKDGGVIHLKTDNKELYQFTKKVAAHNSLEILDATSDLYSGKLPDEILSIRTHYEDKFLTEGLKINYISFRLDKKKIVTDENRRKG